MITIPDEVKTLFQSDSVYKNFHAHFPDGECADLYNGDIESESVTFTESLCSQQYFKFGLAEASSIEFTAIGITNVRGARIQCGIEIDVTSLGNTWISNHPVDNNLSWLTPQTVLNSGTYYYRIPYGEFVIDTCPRDHGAMFRRQITAYTKTVQDNSDMCSVELAKERIPTINWNTYKMNMKMFMYSNLYPYDASKIVDAGYTPETPWSPSTVTTGVVNQFEYDYRIRPSGTTTWYKFRIDIQGCSIPLYSASLGSPSNFYRIQDITSAYEALKTVLRSNFSNYDVMDQNGNIMTAEEVEEFLVTVLFHDIEPKLHFTTNDWEYRDHNYQTVYDEGFSLLDDDVVVYVEKIKGNVSSTIQIPCYLTSRFVDPDTSSIVSVLNDDCTSSVTGNLLITEYINGSTYYDQLEVSLKPTSTAKYKYSSKTYKYSAYEDAFSYADLLCGFLELSGQFLAPRRNGNQELIALDNSSPVTISASDWEEFWWDENDISPITQIDVKYNDGKEEQTKSIVIGSNTGSVYDMTGNEVFKKAVLNETTVTQILTESFMPKVAAINFTPVDLEMRGLPYLEAGDCIQLTAEDNITVTSYILRQEITGVQNLRASVTSTNGELLEVEA